MVIARAQARSLLTDPEMVLFGESRNPMLRSLTDRELTRRIDRARKLRDKSRDLLQRQRLSSRERTGNKGGKSGVANERTARKAEVLDDVLQRFEDRLQQLERSDQPGASRKASTAAARKGTEAGSTAKAKKKPQRGVAAKTTAGAAKKPAAATKKPTGAAGKSSAAAKKASGAAKKSGGAAIRKTGDGASVTAKKSAKKSAAPASGRARKYAVTADQALASTRELLQAKQQRQKRPRGYPGNGDAVQSGSDYQSAEAKAKALELHAGEARMEPIHGSISTRDRKNQAKRDRG